MKKKDTLNWEKAVIGFIILFSCFATQAHDYGHLLGRGHNGLASTAVNDLESISLNNSALKILSNDVSNDSTTLPPMLISPADNTSTSGGSSLIALEYTLPESPLSGTVTLTFTNTSTTNDIVLMMSDDSSFNGNIDGLDFGATPEIFSASSNSLADGVYDITLSYQDANGNAAATDIATGFSFATTNSITLPPALISPADNASTSGGSSLIALEYTLPESPLSGTVTLTFTNTSTTNDIVLMMSDSSSFNGNIDGLDFGATSEILSASSNSLADGVYDITLAYQDANGNAAATDIATGFSFATTNSITLPPTLISPLDNASTSGGSSLIALEYTLPESPLSGTVTLTFTNTSTTNDIVLMMSDSSSFNGNIDGLDFVATPEVLSASSNSLADGVYDITLSYQDANGNAAATDIATGFSFTTATLSSDTFTSNDVTILPNPTVSKVVIHTKEKIKNISLISSLGLQLEVKVDDTINGTYSIDMGNLSNGVYFVVLEMNSKYYTEKIIKK